MKTNLLLLLTAALLVSCASPDHSSLSRPPKPLAKIPQVKLGSAGATTAGFSIAEEEDNYDKRYLDKGSECKFYWTANPTWKDRAPEERHADSTKASDINIVLKNPWIQSRETTNYPVVGIQKRSRVQKLLFFNLSTWDECYLAKINVVQTSESKERYGSIDWDLEKKQAHIWNVSKPTVVSCEEYDKIQHASKCD